MPGRNDDRANLGEQTSSSRSVESVESEEMVARPTQEEADDLSAGDEGIDESSEMSGTDRSEDMPERSGVGSSRSSGRGRSKSRGGKRNEESVSESSREFSGRGGQKGGNRTGEPEGTGYTNEDSVDRSTM